MTVQRLGERGVTVLLEQYLRQLQDPRVLASEAPGRERTLQWAADELRHTAATLHGLTLEEAEYELAAVLREARERLGLMTGSPELSA